MANAGRTASGGGARTASGVRDDGGDSSRGSGSSVITSVGCIIVDTREGKEAVASVASVGWRGGVDGEDNGDWWSERRRGHSDDVHNGLEQFLRRMRESHAAGGAVGSAVARQNHKQRGYDVVLVSGRVEP